MSDPRAHARELARDAIARGDVTGWFETLYGESERDGFPISWVDLEPNPYLVEWLRRRPAPPQRPGSGGRLRLRRRRGAAGQAGLDVTAFDIAPTAIARCRTRFPDSTRALRSGRRAGARPPAGRAPSTSCSRPTRSRFCTARPGPPAPTRSAVGRPRRHPAGRGQEPPAGGPGRPDALAAHPRRAGRLPRARPGAGPPDEILEPGDPPVPRFVAEFVGRP